MTEITFHREYPAREAHAAVNVKVYERLWPDDLEPFAARINADLESIVEGLWNGLCEAFWWQAAPAIARKHGFDDVVSEGRSSGWCVPVRKAQGLTEDDLDGNKKLQRQFIAFQKDIREAVNEAIAQLRRDVKEELREREIDFLRAHSVAVRAIA